MATASMYKASDQVYDYSCSKCEENDLNAEAQHFCPECEHYLCDKCVALRNGYNSKHLVYGRGDIQKWVGFSMDRCDQHGNNLEFHCDDHQELCCHVCVALNHRHCCSISHLPELARNFLKTEEFKQLPAAVDKMRSRLDELKNVRMEDQASLKDSYKNILAEINTARKEINNIFDQLEMKTVEQLESILKDLEKSVKDDIETVVNMHDQLKTMTEKLQQMSGKDKETSSYIGYRSCQNKLIKADSLIQEIEAKPKQRVLFYPITKIETFLKGLDNLGNTDKVHVYSYHSLKSFYVKIECDKCNCYIDSVCEMLNGDIVIADCNNKRVKLLNSQYQVIDHCDLPGPPQHFCHTVGNEIAVAARKEVHFLKVTSGRLQKVRKFSTDHDCFSIADFKDELYVGSKTALYRYTMNGELVEKIYQDKSGDSTVYSCAVSPDGERIYVTNYSAHRLLTLDKSGQVLSTFEDPELKCPTGVCVSPSIHVFVCGQESHTVLQVDREGTQKLATVVRKADGLLRPPSVCFIDKTSSLLVGSYDSIIVFKLC